MMQQWFKDAKLGVFMHWGVYSVLGVGESWSFYNGEISYEDYMAQAKGLTASKYDPKAWAELFNEFGAKYAVLTTKHHDGFAMWDTKLSDLSIVKQSPAGRDVVGPYCEAMREAGIKVGLYFSHLDWSHPDNNAIIRPDADLADNPRTQPQGEPDYERWNNFLKFHRGQLGELMSNYGKIDLLWFDGDWEKNAEQWDMKGLRDYLHSFNPEVIINSRMQGYGDYETPEQGFPVGDPVGPWEYGITVNNSWGYQPKDQNHKSTSRLVRIFTEIISRGGTMLLDIGPKEDGTFQEAQVKRLKEFGAWLHPVEEAIYGTEAGIGLKHYMGPSTMSKDHQTIYLFSFGKGQDLFVKGLRNKIKKITLLKTGEELSYDTMLGAPWNGVPEMVWIPITDEQADDLATVVKIEIEGPVDLFEGAGGAIECN